VYCTHELLALSGDMVIVVIELVGVIIWGVVPKGQRPFIVVFEILIYLLCLV